MHEGITKDLAEHAHFRWGEDGYGTWYVLDLDKLCVWFAQNERRDVDLPHVHSRIREALAMVDVEVEGDFIVHGKSFAILLNADDERWTDVSNIVQRVLRDSEPHKLRCSDAIVSYSKDVKERVPA